MFVAGGATGTGDGELARALVGGGQSNSAR